ncbi:MAG TPA: hypothetical protein VHE13_04515, partial [Opitutus sp.]|nr:hypothetical protein [Opitutus sp.]
MFSTASTSRFVGLLGAWLAFAGAATALAGENEAGRVYIENLTAREFGGHSQVFDTAHSPDGLVYAANRGAVLCYDGERWDHASVPTTWIRGLVWAPDRRVYVAGTDEIGWCAHDPDGVFRYHSLLDQLPADDRTVGPAWSVEAFGDAVFFATSTHVYRWQHGQLRAFAMAAAPRAVLQAIAGRLFLLRTGDALYEWRGDNFDAFSRAPELTGSLRFALFEPAPGRLVAAVADGSLLDVHEGTVTPWACPAAAWMHEAGF